MVIMHSLQIAVERDASNAPPAESNDLIREPDF